MRTRRCNPKYLESLFLRDPDFSGALIQALETYCTFNSIYIRHSRACDAVDDISFLRYISRFFVQKAGQRASRRFHRLALLISRKLHKKNRCALNSLHTLHTPIHYPPCADSDSEIPTSPADGTTQQTSLVSHHTPTNTAPDRSTARRECVRTSSSRRSTFCGPCIASVSKPGFGSPIHPCTFNPRLDPPLTPVNQILSTPLHPPRIETKEPRTPCDRVLLDREFDLTRLSLANARSPEEISYHVYPPNHRLSFRNRLWVRRLSYPHFNNSPISHPVCSSLKMPDITIAFNANHQLASPLNVRSSISTRCTPQMVEGSGPPLQWSPRCLRCFV